MTESTVQTPQTATTTTIKTPGAINTLLRSLLQGTPYRTPDRRRFGPVGKTTTVKPVLGDHIQHGIFLAFQVFRQVVAYCCMKVVLMHELSALLSFSNKQPPVKSDFHVT